MNDIYLYSRIDSILLIVKSSEKLNSPVIADAAGKNIHVSVLRETGAEMIMDASALEHWTPNHPVLYYFVDKKNKRQIS